MGKYGIDRKKLYDFAVDNMIKTKGLMNPNYDSLFSKIEINNKSKENAIKELEDLRNDIKSAFENIERISENSRRLDESTIKDKSLTLEEIIEMARSRILGNQHSGYETLLGFLDQIKETLKNSNGNRLYKTPETPKDQSHVQKTKPELLMIAVAVILMVVEVVFTGMMIRNVLKNGYEMKNIVMNVVMATITVMVMFCVIGYVMNRNRSLWHDVAMIGGSAVMAFMRICVLAFLSKYMSIMNIIIMAIGVAIIIASGIAIANKKKIENNDGGNDKGEDDKNRMTKNVIVTLSTCVMAITGWVLQNVMVSELNNKIPQQYNSKMVGMILSSS